ncbi:hypothetical protein GCM10027566_04170 [Arachidicoccus ginsenosidivorans]|uniref:Uncharacterized protein n=1 Tax=Arachidicoccus ginsenosidivorans TaxID=496057 RepID=A0A5B8VR29_9BACT|nr:hypothetical protein [Arachidicoccus ginsenosidivorans]QEC73889.1 hypothetical protein FSB73_21720 [Arachidicoccus ginsenosidivorans]
MESRGIKSRIDVGDYTWDYKFSNGKTGFVTFFCIKSVLTKIILQMGSFEQIFPLKPGFDDLYHIKEFATASDFKYLKEALIRKYGQPNDSISFETQPGLKDLIWDFKYYQVDLLYNHITKDRCEICYNLSTEVKKDIEQMGDNSEVNMQSNHL